MFAIVRDPIDPRPLEAGVRDAARGAVVTFLGTVRETANDGRAVTRLSYEAHEPLCMTTFEAIATEIRARHGDVRISIVHRVGDLDVGEIAVAVTAASAHRAEAFEACRYAIEELKRRAPIWKKERYANAASEWIANE